MQKVTSSDDSPTQRDQQANARLLRGLALLEENTPVSLREAVRCFDGAIELRRTLPLAENHWFRYGLIAGWMNRGDALTRLGSTEDLNEALRSYDEAFVQLRELPMHESPLFIKRLAIAWLNRGVTHLKQATPASVGQAVPCFQEALAAARNFSAVHSADGAMLMAAAWMNLGNALIQGLPPDPEKAQATAKEALNLCQPMERNDAAFAEISFKARHILCQALAQQLADRQLASAQRERLLAEASDVVDEGMALARHWEARGEPRFRGPAGELFRFGCRVYQTYQPHFLTEFLLENLDPTCSDGTFARDLQMHGDARDALWILLGQVQREGFRSFNTPRFATLLETLRKLRITEERLTELRRNNLGGADKNPAG
jgi:hypothetical protein